MASVDSVQDCLDTLMLTLFEKSRSIQNQNYSGKESSIEPSTHSSPSDAYLALINEINLLPGLDKTSEDQMTRLLSLKATYEETRSRIIALETELNMIAHTLDSQLININYNSRTS